MSNTAFVSIGDLRRGRRALSRGDAPAPGTGCGTSAGPADLPAATWEKVRDHPCYSEDAHHHYARMHVAVAPACNIQCNYCNRKYDCSNESRPGVVSRKLTPEQAVNKVLAVAGAIPQMTVLGIAGPGDALANPDKTFETFRRLRAQAPDLKLCLSTNGLALPKHVDEICRLGVDHVTITINMVDPEVGAQIYPWIFWEHRRVHGLEAARILHAQQMLGLEMLQARGVLVKVNSVLIPGINDAHLVEVNREVKRRGAFLHNIMPLISAPEHGTAFGLGGQRAPTAQELQAVQDACAGGANLMRHCRQCRADAVGLLGEDRSAEFAHDDLEPAAYDPQQRRAARLQAERERQARQAAKSAALRAAPPSDTAAGAELTLRVAVATRGQGKVNQHFGHAREFQIYEVGAHTVRFVGHRRVDGYCQGGWGEDEALPSIVEAINDCHAVLVSKIGRCPREELQAAGIEPVDRYAHEFIETAAMAWLADYRGRLASGAVAHRPRGDARLRQGAYSGSALAVV